MLVYERTFRFSASHFNSRESYETSWNLVEGKDLSTSALFLALRDIHGHNFRVVVMLEVDELNDQGWIVDDVKLEKIVMEWENTNLSLHPDFLALRQRATTELMAYKLVCKMVERLDWHEHLTVRVYETDDIYADATNN